MNRQGKVRGRRLLFAAALVLGGSALAADFATDTPETTIATLQHGLVELAAAKPNVTVAERYRALEPLIKGTHDLPYIAEFALRRQWPSLSEPDRQRFIAAFERLSVMTYASRFKRVGAETFTVKGASEAGPERVEVATAVARPGDTDVALEYLLQRRPDGWKIINIIADGVSDLALKRAEYQRIISLGSLDDLIAELQAQAARLEQN